jgi:hypothetical protein
LVIDDELELGRLPMWFGMFIDPGNANAEPVLRAD